MAPWSHLVGTWRLAGAGCLALSEDEDGVPVGGHDIEPAQMARFWLSGRGPAPELSPARGFRLTITPTGRFAETMADRSQFLFMDLTGLGMDLNEPFPGRLRPASDGRLLVFALGVDGVGECRYDDGDSRLCESMAVDEDGDLLRVQNLVTDDSFFTRAILAYRR